MTWIGRHWRRLLLLPGLPSDAAPAGAALAVVPAPADFTPRERELVHAHGPAHGRDPERALDLGTGTLIVTSMGVIYVNGDKRWRFAWRGIEGVGLDEGRTLEVETRSGRYFSFRLSSAAEAEAMRQVAHAAWANRSRDDEA